MIFLNVTFDEAEAKRFIGQCEVCGRLRIRSIRSIRSKPFSNSGIFAVTVTVCDRQSYTLLNSQIANRVDTQIRRESHYKKKNSIAISNNAEDNTVILFIFGPSSMIKDGKRSKIKKNYGIRIYLTLFESYPYKFSGFVSVFQGALATIFRGDLSSAETIWLWPLYSLIPGHSKNFTVGRQNRWKHQSSGSISRLLRSRVIF